MALLTTLLLPVKVSSLVALGFRLSRSISHLVVLRQFEPFERLMPSPQRVLVPLLSYLRRSRAALADWPVPVPNMKRVASVHQVFVCQRYENNNYLGTSTSCVESTVCGLNADKDKNEARSFFTSSVGTSEYQIRSIRRNSKFDEYGDIRDQTQKSSSAFQVCS